MGPKMAVLESIRMASPAAAGSKVKGSNWTIAILGSDFALGHEVLDLTPGSRKSVLDRYFGMLMSWVISGRMINNDVLVRRNRQPDVDLKPNAMAMLSARSNNGYAASCDTFVVRLQPLDLL
jgi:hypothetical protein